MQLSIESTDKVVAIEGVEYRVWQGTSPKGVLCLVLVRRIAVDKTAPTDEFDTDEHLKERPPEKAFSDDPEIPF